jgi:hypothetical protein
MEFGGPFFKEFATAWSEKDGYRLSRTLSPDLPTERLRKIWRSQNEHDIKGALRRGLQNSGAALEGLVNNETQGWVEVYIAYWKAVGDILAARESSSDNSKVGLSFILSQPIVFAWGWSARRRCYDIEWMLTVLQSSQVVWDKACDAWRDLLIVLIRGYQNHGFEAWTIPCLYVVGRHLRLFSIKADEERSINNSFDDNTATNFQDDVDPETGKHEKLEECARVLNRMFMLCATDR